MKFLTLLLVVMLSGCSWLQPPTITDPKTGVVYKGKEAVRVYAHQAQQDQLAQRWQYLIAEANREGSKTAAGEATRNMLMQTIMLQGIAGSGGGEYFAALAEKFRMWGQLGQTALAAGLPILGQYLLYGSQGVGGSISEEIHAGRDIVMNASMPSTVPPPGTVIPPELGGYPSAHYSATFGGIGNQVSSPQGLNAVYRSTAAQNRASGSLQLDSHKPIFTKDNQCTGGACIDDRDDVRSGLFR